MSELAPLLRDQRKIDVEHLKLLAVFHFVVAGLAVLGILFLFMHYAMMSTFMNNPDLWKNQKKPDFDPKQFFDAFKWFYVFMGSMFLLNGIGNLISGFCIRARRHRIFSLIVAGVNCFLFPFGTALGVFTFVVLLRDSVKEAYEASTLR
jgi:hypothetical protein